ncbi:hypothetical protein JYU34_018794 [Plutella xylostella]|uniref:Uncharacterized protein n=1 Tax=Plutella xylostella TaxID=51655 RepID=A0ABQ7PYH2_PLUXY|nr:hypothetical protein JYU34_018794 [Plutella xylostella]
MNKSINIDSSGYLAQCESVGFSADDYSNKRASNLSLNRVSAFHDDKSYDQSSNTHTDDIQQDESWTTTLTDLDDSSVVEFVELGNGIYSSRVGTEVSEFSHLEVTAESIIASISKQIMSEYYENDVYFQHQVVANEKIPKDSENDLDSNESGNLQSYWSDS